MLFRPASRHWLASRRGVYYKNHPDDYTSLRRLGCIAAIRLDGGDTWLCWKMAMEEVQAVQKNITITHDNTSFCNLLKRVVCGCIVEDEVPCQSGQCPDRFIFSLFPMLLVIFNSFYEFLTVYAGFSIVCNG